MQSFRLVPQRAYQLVGKISRIISIEYFRQMFGLSKNKRIRFLQEIWPTQTNLQNLENDFSEEELKYQSEI